MRRRVSRPIVPARALSKPTSGRCTPSCIGPRPATCSAPNRSPGPSSKASSAGSGATARRTASRSGTQRARLGALQRFFAHLCRENRLAANPAADLELPRKPHRLLPRGLSREEIAAVLAVPDVADPLGVRDRAILETLYATGARRSELVRLDLADLDAAGATLHIRRGKGGRSRVVPVGARALEWLARYLRAARPRLLLDATEPALFLSGYGERLSPAYLGNWVRRTVDAAGVAKAGSCHLFRHSCAVHMLENGADSRFIQQLLGHASAETTAIYTEATIAALRAVYARTHPADQAASALGAPAPGSPPGHRIFPFL